MYRESIHRGRRKSDKSWVIGEAYDCCYTCRKRKAHITPFEGSYNKVRDKVEPKTVGEYFGLKDSDNTPIFEGDVLLYKKSGEYEIWIVTFDDVNSRLRLFDLDIWHDMEARECISSQFRIIGNIHDNPEWLDGNFHDLILSDKDITIRFFSGFDLDDFAPGIREVYDNYIKRAKILTKEDKKREKEFNAKIEKKLAERIEKHGLPF